MNFFKDRADAGKQLAEKLLRYQHKDHTLILALPRGGVPVAFEIAKILHAPITVFLVRKLGVPGHEELAMGAIAEGNTYLLNQTLIDQLDIQPWQISLIVEKEKQELSRRLQRYRHGKELPSLKNKTIILVDDGIATGATFKAAIQGLKRLKPKKLIVATPVASKDSLEEIRPLVDEVVCLAVPEPFYGVGQWYEQFDQTTDEEVLHFLKAAPVPLNFME